MSKNQLKSLIKECLVEVLVEGLNPRGNSPEVSLKETRSKTSRQVKRRSASRPATENINFDKRVNESVAACTEDPILGNILADTARTTLQEQLGQENQSSHAQSVAVNGDPAAKAISGADPTDLFGDASNNWAALAFDEVNK